MNLSRRGFVSGMATVLGYAGLRPPGLFAQAPAPARPGQTPAYLTSAAAARVAEYDPMAKLASNENPWGPLDSVMEAMNYAWKYSNRYGYPDGNVLQAIADHHKVSPQHILLGAGSGEILDVVGATFLEGPQNKVLGVEPTYSTVYQYATSIKADAIRLPLKKDYTQDIPAFITAARRHYRELGFIYLCNPNNPTGLVVPKQEVKQLLDGIPEDLPVLIDEAYHHFVQSADYAPSLPYVLEGRPVIIARTFSKIFGIAAMRLGYAIARPDFIRKMEPHAMNSINSLVKWGAVAGLADTAGQKRVLDMTISLREKTIADLRAHGYEVLPSETNYFMVGIRREVQPVIDEFRKRGVLVGRAFPPMTQHMRVSVGKEDEMARFTAAFKEIFPATKTATGAAQ
jgi:histidinol-phosphate aminotransferase